MKALSKADAQRRADRISEFQSELRALEDEEVLSLHQEQRSAVATYHDNLLTQLAATFDIDANSHERQLSLGMKIASFLGALALGASIFFLFYQFWGRFPTTLQVLILIAAPMLSLAVTMLLAQKERSGYYTKLSAMVTFVCFVLNLSMLGQIFNITPSPNAFFVWALFSFLLAYASDTRLLLAAAIVSSTFFLSAQAGTWSGLYWFGFGERPENFFPAALLLFLASFAAHNGFSGFRVIYRVFAMLIFFLPVLILSHWGAISYLPLDQTIIEGSYQVAGFLFSAAAIWLGIKKEWPDLVNTGNVFFTLFLYTKFFDWWWEWMPKYLFFLIIALASIAMLFVFKRLRRTSTLVTQEAHR